MYKGFINSLYFVLICTFQVNLKDMEYTLNDRSEMYVVAYLDNLKICVSYLIAK